MKWPSYHVNTIRNKKVIPVWNSRRCDFSRVNSPCGAVVKELLAREKKLGSTPGDAVFCFFLPFFFFFLFGPCFLTLLFLLACFPLFLLLTLLIVHLDQYIFYVYVRSFSFGKGFQELLICMLARLTARKNHKLLRRVPPLKQLNFFQC